MTKLTRTLAVAAFALVAGPALAAPSEVTLYDAPQQKDAFFQAQRGVALDVTVTGSIAAPVLGAAEMPFWSAHERIRLMADDNG